MHTNLILGFTTDTTDIQYFSDIKPKFVLKCYRPILSFATCMDRYDTPTFKTEAFCLISIVELVKCLMNGKYRITFPFFDDAMRVPHPLCN